MMGIGNKTGEMQACQLGLSKFLLVYRFLTPCFFFDKSDPGQIFMVKPK